MIYLAQLFLPFAACLGLSALTAGLWWSSLHSPWTYGLLSFLILLGLDRVIKAFVEFLNLFGAGRSYFLIRAKEPARFAQVLTDAMTIEALVITVIVLVAGYPILRALRSLLLKP